MVDLSPQQNRSPLVLDLYQAGQLHTIGSPLSGRSQTLRTLAGSLNALPHCGAASAVTRSSGWDGCWTG